MDKQALGIGIGIGLSTGWDGAYTDGKKKGIACVEGRYPSIDYLILHT